MHWQKFRSGTAYRNQVVAVTEMEKPVALKSWYLQERLRLDGNPGIWRRGEGCRDPSDSTHIFHRP